LTVNIWIGSKEKKDKGKVKKNPMYTGGIYKALSIPLNNGVEWKRRELVRDSRLGCGFRQCCIFDLK